MLRPFLLDLVETLIPFIVGVSAFVLGKQVHGWPRPWFTCAVVGAVSIEIAAWPAYYLFQEWTGPWLFRVGGEATPALWAALLLLGIVSRSPRRTLSQGFLGFVLGVLGLFLPRRAAVVSGGAPAPEKCGENRPMPTAASCSRTASPVLLPSPSCFCTIMEFQPQKARWPIGEHLVLRYEPLCHGPCAGTQGPASWLDGKGRRGGLRDMSAKRCPVPRFHVRSWGQGACALRGKIDRGECRDGQSSVRRSPTGSARGLRARMG